MEVSMSLLSFLKNKKTNKQMESNQLTNSNNQSEEAKFVIRSKKQGVTIKSALMEYAAISRNLDVKRFSNMLILVTSAKMNEYPFSQMNGVNSSRVGKMICDRKQDTRSLLKNNGLSVIDSKMFFANEYEKAEKFVKSFGFPVVVKPTNLARGRGITTDIKNINDFKQAWEDALKVYKVKRNTHSLLIERHFYGEDYRFFVVGDKVISATHRKRANITGDGKSTILELIQKKNKERSKNPYLSDYLIPEDIDKLDRLKNSNYNLSDVPKKGEEIILRSQSNLSAGGDSIDVTDIVHKDFLTIAIEAVKSIPGIEYAGVDIIAQDITQKPNKDNHIVGEVEFSPAPLAHFPFVGKRRDMAGAILDYYLEKE